MNSDLLFLISLRLADADLYNFLPLIHKKINDNEEYYWLQRIKARKPWLLKISSLNELSSYLRYQYFDHEDIDNINKIRSFSVFYENSKISLTQYSGYPIQHFYIKDKNADPLTTYHHDEIQYNILLRKYYNYLTDKNFIVLAFLELLDNAKVIFPFVLAPYSIYNYKAFTLILKNIEKNLPKEYDKDLLYQKIFDDSFLFTLIIQMKNTEVYAIFQYCLDNNFFDHLFNNPPGSSSRWTSWEETCEEYIRRFRNTIIYIEFLMKNNKLNNNDLMKLFDYCLSETYDIDIIKYLSKEIGITKLQNRYDETSIYIYEETDLKYEQYLLYLKFIVKRLNVKITPVFIDRFMDIAKEYDYVEEAENIIQKVQAF